MQWQQREIIDGVSGHGGGERRVIGKEVGDDDWLEVAIAKMNKWS